MFRWQTGWRLLVPLSLWTWLFWGVHDEWSLNPQYNFGWIIPPAALFLFIQRWRRRPAPGQPRRAALARAGQILLLATMLPVRVIEIANPDWRLLGYALGFVASTYSILEVYQAGGLPWAKHFLFPLLFPLLGVPWLIQLETVVVQALARLVAAAAVEVASWIGIGAFRSGNVIELHNGLLGVDEACSGVRTLQTGLMLTLFLGELFQLRVSRRAWLVAIGALWNILCNIARASLLMIVAADSGFGALAIWHDRIGLILLVTGIAGIFLLSWFWWEAIPEDDTALGARFAPAHLAFKFAALAWLGLVFGAAEGWYRAHETRLTERPPWQVRWPAAATDFRALPIADVTHAILHYDSASSAQWNDPPGVRWWGFYARWRPSRAALQLVRSHSPDICLPATGRVFEKELANVTAGDGSHRLVFRSYQFEEAERPLFVFVAVQDDKTLRRAPDSPPRFDTAGRLRAAWEGRRNLGQRLLEVAIFGLDDFAAAREALLENVPALIGPADSRG